MCSSRAGGGQWDTIGGRFREEKAMQRWWRRRGGSHKAQAMQPRLSQGNIQHCQRAEAEQGGRGGGRKACGSPKGEQKGVGSLGKHPGGVGGGGGEAETHPQGWCCQVGPADFPALPVCRQRCWALCHRFTCLGIAHSSLQTPVGGLPEPFRSQAATMPRGAQKHQNVVGKGH